MKMAQLVTAFGLAMVAWIMWLVTTVHVERAFIHGGLVRYHNIAGALIDCAIALLFSAGALILARRYLDNQSVRIAIAITVVVAVGLGLYGAHDQLEFVRARERF
jgi:hypothetical protein